MPIVVDVSIIWSIHKFRNKNRWQANNTSAYKNEVYMLPKHLDEKVARLHLEKIGVELETLRPDQAEYIGVTVEGPYKPEYYRY